MAKVKCPKCETEFTIKTKPKATKKPVAKSVDPVPETVNPTSEPEKKVAWWDKEL